MLDPATKSLIDIELNEMSLDAKDKPKLMDKISDFEEKLNGLEKVEIKVSHHFSKDVYAREIFIPKGTIVVGKIHKHENLNILSQGDILVISIDGAKRLKAPATIVSSPGVKRVAYAHEDSTWITVHGTSETDVEKIEDEFIAKSYDEVPKLTEEELNLIEGAKKCLG